MNGSNDERGYDAHDRNTWDLTVRREWRRGCAGAECEGRNGGEARNVATTGCCAGDGYGVRGNGGDASGGPAASVWTDAAPAGTVSENTKSYNL